MTLVPEHAGAKGRKGGATLDRMKRLTADFVRFETSRKYCSLVLSHETHILSQIIIFYSATLFNIHKTLFIKSLFLKSLKCMFSIAPVEAKTALAV